MTKNNTKKIKEPYKNSIMIRDNIRIRKSKKMTQNSIKIMKIKENKDKLWDQLKKRLKELEIELWGMKIGKWENNKKTKKKFEKLIKSKT